MVKMTEWDADGKLRNQKELVKTVTYKDSEPIYELKSIEVAPVFSGGIPALSSFIASNVRYPSDAAKNGIGGKVIVMFVINKKGKVIYSEIVQNVYPS